MVDNSLGAVGRVLDNPIVKAGLRLAGPQASLIADGLKALMLAFGGRRKRKYKAKDVFKIIDKRAAELIETLATTRSKHERDEVEIRLHELLEIGQRWDRKT